MQNAEEFARRQEQMVRHVMEMFESLGGLVQQPEQRQVNIVAATFEKVEKSCDMLLLQAKEADHALEEGSSRSKSNLDLQQRYDGILGVFAKKQP
jgi:hypothetical protein